ncbi:MAG TPA: PspC domain-containing protein [Balneolaceae bacterium]|nr:PspC domain-containing protein [Balneolaceae bacterium]
MAQTRQKTRQRNLDSVMDFGDDELQSTLHEFMKDEKKENTNIWNFATIAGIAIFFVGVVYIIQSLFLEAGSDLSDLISAMPVIGGILVTLVGFGFLVGDRKNRRRERKRKRQQKSQKFDFDFEGDESGEYEDYTLNNDLGSKKKSKNKRSAAYNYNRKYDAYAFGRSKKLYKSRTDKKWAGVCGGLAKYFGISSTVIRLLFVITFFAGSGASLLLYIALSIALDKEPPELKDDFDY